MSPTFPPCAKVYCLNCEGEWDDRGTGYVTLDFMEDRLEVAVHVTGEPDNDTLLLHIIRSDDIYRKEKDAIIAWRDPIYSSDLAISFQETSDCDKIWGLICNAQRLMQLKYSILTFKIELARAGLQELDLSI